MLKFKPAKGNKKLLRVLKDSKLNLKTSALEIVQEIADERAETVADKIASQHAEVASLPALSESWRKRKEQNTDAKWLHMGDFIETIKARYDEYTSAWGSDAVQVEVLEKGWDEKNIPARPIFHIDYLNSLSKIEKKFQKAFNRSFR